MPRIFRFLFIGGVFLAIGGSVTAGIVIRRFDRDLPDYQQLAHYRPATTTRVHAGDGRLLAEFAVERRIFVPIKAIPKRVLNAFLSAEDKNFYSHRGIDPVSILRAAVTDVSRLRDNRRPVGASTITQQVAKNMLLSNQISIERKIKEMLLASRIEAALPKDRILELYLNEIYLGGGAYGVASAALTYFDKSLDELTLGEAAFLAGLPKAPNRYNLARYPEAAKTRRDWVLDRMIEDGAVTPEEAAQAKAQALELHHRQEAEQAKAPYFAEEVRRDLLARYGEKMLYGAGLSIHTSLDPRLQAAADRALRNGLIAYERSHGGWRGPVTRIDLKGDWAARLARVPVPSPRWMSCWPHGSPASSCLHCGMACPAWRSAPGWAIATRSPIEGLPDPEPVERRRSKQADVVPMLRRPEGVTVDEIRAVTGWQAHTGRGVFSGALKKKLGLAIASAEEERGRVYRITAQADARDPVISAARLASDLAGLVLSVRGGGRSDRGPVLATSKPGSPGSKR